MNRFRRFRSAAHRKVIFVLFLVAPACAIQTPADPDRGRSDGADPRALRWPERRTGDLDAILANMPRRVSYFVTSRGSTDASANEADRRIVFYEVIDARRAGIGILRKLQRLEPDGKPADEPSVYEFLVFRPGASPGDEAATDAESRFNPLAPDRRRVQFLPPLHEGPPRGLLVYVEPLIVMPGDAAVIRVLRERGWFVVETAFVGLVNELFSVDIASDSEADVDAAAERIAERADGQLARCAYAVEGALDYLAQTRPDLPRRPLVAAGFSAGALALSTVLARMPDRFDAAVYTTGGAPLLDVSQNSTMSDGGLKIRYKGGRVPTEIMKRLRERYLHHSGLDAYHAAVHLRGIPVLMLHGICDTMVPSFTGNCLYERLERPERWTYLGGHIWVFTVLPLEAGRIADWIERQVARPESTSQPIEMFSTSSAPAINSP